MYLSVLLIVLFQIYWLRQVYQDTFRNMRREISVVLRENLVREQLQVLMGDSAHNFIGRDTFRFEGNRVAVVQLNDSAPRAAGWNGRDTIQFNFRMPARTDSGEHRKTGTRFMAIESDDDLQHTRKLIVTMPVSQKRFEDSTLVQKYGEILQKAGLPSHFTVTRSEKNMQPRMGYPAAVGATNVRQGFGGFAALNLLLVDFDFGRPFSHILGKMYGQVAVAFIMTGIVILAFRFMYRSLREQHQLAIQKNNFISNMTHELKTPVATVSVAIEALKNFSALDDPARTREYLDISSAELTRLNLLIDKVLRINMFEADKLELDAAPADLGQLTTEVIQAQQLQAGKVHAIIHWAPPDATVVVKGDRLHLMSVLYNLLDNALKYRSERPEIWVTLAQQGHDAIWTIRDNGPGIAAEYRQKVFEKFFRIPNGDRHDVKGYGLGLSYVHEVVQKMGGTIGVDSDAGKGCTFTIKLPALA